MLKIFGIVRRLFSGGKNGGSWKGYGLAILMAFGAFFVIEHWRQKKAKTEILLRQAQRKLARAKTEALAEDVKAAQEEVDGIMATIAEIDHQAKVNQEASQLRLKELRDGKLLAPHVADELADGLGI